MDRSSMKRSSMKRIAWGLCLIFTLALFAAPAAAATPSPDAETVHAPADIPQPDAAATPSSETVISLEEAIVIAKTHFTVPDNYDNFNSWFSDYDVPQWQLSWQNSSGQGYLEIAVNAVNGCITSKYGWKEDSGAAAPAKLGIDEAQNLAAAKLAELLPEQCADLRLNENRTSVQLSGVPSATFFWERCAGDIPVANDSASMAVDLRDGSIREYFLNWTQGELPAADAVISPQAAADAFTAAGMLELQYLLLSRNYKPLKSDGEPLSAIPVFALTHASMGYIDAFTGEPYAPADYYRFDQRYMEKENAAMTMDSAGGGAVSLTPQEIDVIVANERLITKEQATAVIDKWFELDASLRLTTGTLNRQWYDENRYYWNLSWESMKDGQYAYAYAQVDALTSEVVSYYGWTDTDSAAKDRLSVSAAQQSAEKLAAAIAPDKFKNVQADAIDESYYDDDNDYTYDEYSFNYTRLANGLLCPGNGISLTVNRITGAVTAYNLHWNDIVFAPPKGAITPQAAELSYLTQSPLALRYIQESDRFGQTAFRLVYAPNFLLSRATVIYLDATSGAAIDSSGQAMQADGGMQSFDDIAGHFAENEITLLGQAGLMGEYSPEFRPDENITVLSFLRALYGLYYGSWYNETDAEEIMRLARERKLIDDTVNAADPLTRERASVIVIRFQNLQTVAELTDIFLTPWQDDSVSAANHGYAALCWGLNIMRGDGVNYNGQSLLTRAESACILLRAVMGGRV